MPEPERRPAFYGAGPGPAREWWTLLHPPYTAWHLSYVAIGAALAPHLDGGRLLASLVAFFAAVGIAAHALDELRGHPLRTHISDRTLEVAAAGGLTVAIAIGVAGIVVVGWVLIPFVVVGPLLAIGYNLELFGGRVHTDLGFAAAWGAFPVLAAYVAQTGTLRPTAVLAAAAALGFSLAQRALSTPARTIRRRVRVVTGQIEYRDGRTATFDEAALLAPLERALKACAGAMTLLAIALVATHISWVSI